MGCKRKETQHREGNKKMKLKQNDKNKTEKKKKQKIEKEIKVIEMKTKN